MARYPARRVLMEKMELEVVMEEEVKGAGDGAADAAEKTVKRRMLIKPVTPLAAWILKADVDISVLAERCAVHTSTLYAAARGIAVSRKTAIAIERETGIDMKELMAGSIAPAEPVVERPSPLLVVDPPLAQAVLPMVADPPVKAKSDDEASGVRKEVTMRLSRRALLAMLRSGGIAAPEGATISIKAVGRDTFSMGGDDELRVSWDEATTVTT